MSLLKNKTIRCFISCSIEELNKAHFIKKFLSKEGIETFVWSEGIFSTGLSIVESLRDAISKVDFVICLVPANEKENAFTKRKYIHARDNVMFELGLVVGLGKQVFLLVEDNTSTNMPVDLSSMLYLKYDQNNIESSLHNIRNWVMHYFSN